jgi:hypothetical protein
MAKVSGLETRAAGVQPGIFSWSHLPLCPKALYLRTPLFLILKFGNAGKA